MLEKTEGPIKNEQWRDIGNAGHTRHKIKIKIVYSMTNMTDILKETVTACPSQAPVFFTSTCVHLGLLFLVGSVFSLSF
jgi:hypothetical protein